MPTLSRDRQVYRKFPRRGQQPSDTKQSNQLRPHPSPRDVPAHCKPFSVPPPNASGARNGSFLRRQRFLGAQGGGPQSSSSRFHPAAVRREGFDHPTFVGSFAKSTPPDVPAHGHLR